ncbi:MAG: phage antirepressor KilAC domain-containing protein [Ruminococcus sp.]|nr:phage antirepressor KilAC domain-containing protein [Ruminococcus sp.]
MTELIKINYDSENPTVSGRELHEALGVKTAYKDWFPRMCEYGFEEGKDFCSFLSESTGGRPSTDHQLTISMAKEICMLQRNEYGKMFRQYFITVENQWNTPEAVMARALKLADKNIEALKQTNIALLKQAAENKPKIDFANAVATSETSILIGELAKLMQQNGIDIGQNRLFKWLKSNGYLIRSGDMMNLPTQRSMKMGLFEIKERPIEKRDGSVFISRTPKVTGKGQIYFINKFLAG